jgi:hypothetical protein
MLDAIGVYLVKVKVRVYCTVFCCRKVYIFVGGLVWRAAVAQ